MITKRVIWQVNYLPSWRAKPGHPQCYPGTPLFLSSSSACEKFYKLEGQDGPTIYTYFCKLSWAWWIIGLVQSGKILPNKILCGQSLPMKRRSDERWYCTMQYLPPSHQQGMVIIDADFGHHMRTLEPMVLDAKYIALKNNIIKAERRVLKELGFCVHVKHPHKMIVMYLQQLELQSNKRLVQTAWNYMNDSLRTDVFVRYSPETIACACIYLSARQLSVVLPSEPDWYGLMNATEEQMQEISLTILKLYTHKRKLYSELEREVERCRATLQAAKMKAKGLLSTDGINSAAGTPTSFSPHSSSAQNSPKVKTESPALPNSYKVGNNTATEENNGASSVSVKNENGKIPVIKKSSKSRSPSRSVSSGRSSKSSRSRSRSKERDRKSGRSKPKEKRRKRDDPGARHHHSRSRKRKYSHSPSRSRSRSRSRSNSYDRHKKYHRRSPHRDSRSDKHYHRDRSRSRSRSYERVSDKYRKVPKHDSSRGKDRR